MPSEPTFSPSPAPISDGRVAPLRPLDRAWLMRWSGDLDAARQPSVSGAAAVSWLLRRADAERVVTAESTDPD